MSESSEAAIVVGVSISTTRKVKVQEPNRLSAAFGESCFAAFRTLAILFVPAAWQFAPESFVVSGVCL